MPFGTGSVQTSGFEIVSSNFEYLEREFYDTLYTLPNFWRKVLPEASLKQDIPGGAQTYSYGVRDRSGRGAIIGSRGQKPPIVGLSVSKPTTLPLVVCGVGGLISREDIRVYEHAMRSLGQTNTSLDTEITEIMMKASDDHVEGLFFYGDKDAGIEPWMDNPEITKVDADQGVGGFREWDKKTPDEVLYDLNKNMSEIMQNTRMNFVPGGVYLPIKQHNYISTTRIVDRDMTILEYLKLNNVFTAQTGQPLKIQIVPHLEGAAAAGKDRMVIQSEDPKCHLLPSPIPYTLLPPQPVLYDTFLLAEYKIGGYDNRFPDSIRYVDQI